MPTFLGATGKSARRIWLADKLAGIPAGYSVESLAAECDVGTDTIYRDLDSDEFQTHVKTRIHKMARGFGVSKAFRNVLKAINDGDVKTSKWLLERCGIFEMDTGGNEYNLLLAKIFGDVSITPAAGNGNGHHPPEDEI